jgi:hypothetical protein
MYKVAMLEEQHAPSLWYNIDTAVHAAVEERSSAAFELLLPVLQYCIVQVEMQCEIRAFGAVGRLVRTIAMR